MSDSAENKTIVPIFTGPTGSGKSGVIARLLEVYPRLQIISADSRQIYKNLNIGTDIPSHADLARYKYHLIDIVEPGERYTAWDFIEDASRIIAETLNRKGMPVVCGGTGLYIKSLVDGMVEIPDNDFAIRSRLESEAVEKGPEYLYKKLQEIDPQEASKIHPNNLRRITRALEIYYITGRPKSQAVAETKPPERSYDFEIVCLLPSRMRLYNNINDRVDRMIKGGLLSEVETLHNSEWRAKIDEINVIGYGELFQYFDDKNTLEEALNLMKQNSRRYAKRQITWLNSMKKIRYFETADDVVEFFLDFWRYWQIKS